MTNGLSLTVILEVSASANVSKTSMPKVAIEIWRILRTGREYLCLTDPNA